MTRDDWRELLLMLPAAALCLVALGLFCAWLIAVVPGPAR